MKQTILAALVILMVGCGAGADQASVQNESDVTTTQLGLSWEKFQEIVVKVPGTEDGYVFDGDTFVASSKELRKLYDDHIQQGNLIINQVGGGDDRWTDAQKLNLTYCISNSFGARKSAVVTAMAGATGAWEGAANVKYVYASSQDGNCNGANGNVVFDVNPINVNGQFLARAFFPAQPRSERNVQIDNTSFAAGSNLVGILRHELGHTLGFRHEHTRPESGTCFEDNSWRVLTSYDSASVMHYPQCNGTGSFASLQLTARDASGAASVYGAPGGGPPPPPPPGGTVVTDRFSNVSLARNATRSFSFSVKAGTTFTATTTGAGDVDLFVRFGSSTTIVCRSESATPNESCIRTVPAGITSASVQLLGYTAATANLAVTYTKP
jgi:serine protease